MSVRSAAAPSSSDVAAIEESISRIVMWATRNDVQQETMRRAKCDLPRGHVWLLARLRRLGPARPTELAAALGVDNSTLTPQAQRLERDGYISRETDPSDRRAALLQVTRSGLELLVRLHETRRAMYAELVADWPAEERAAAATYLSRLAELLAER